MTQQILDAAKLPHVPTRHVGRGVVAVILLVLLLWLVQSLAFNRALDWPTVWKYFLDYNVLGGLGRTLLITAISIVVAIIIGVTTSAVLEKCAELGPGTHFEDGVTYTCG